MAHLLRESILLLHLRAFLGLLTTSRRQLPTGHLTLVYLFHAHLHIY